MKRSRLRLGSLLWLTSVVAVAALATAGVAAQGRQRPAPEGAREPAKAAPRPKAGPGAAAPDMPANRALAKEQLALIDKALADLRRLAQNGDISFGDAAFSLWGRRRVEALRTAGAEKAEIVAALEKYIDTLKQQEAMAEKMRQLDRATQVEVYDAQFRRMEAEIWLNEEKAR